MLFCVGYITQNIIAALLLSVCVDSTAFSTARLLAVSLTASSSGSSSCSTSAVQQQQYHMVRNRERNQNKSAYSSRFRRLLQHCTAAAVHISVVPALLALLAISRRNSPTEQQDNQSSTSWFDVVDRFFSLLCVLCSGLMTGCGPQIMLVHQQG